MHVAKTESAAFAAPTYAGRAFDRPLPQHRLPAQGIGPRAASQLIRDELSLDGNPTLNLASFVTTWMEPEAQALAVDCAAKNLIDQDEYPQTQRIHERVISMLAGLFHAPAHGEPIGTATVGSSEAIMLAMLAHKRSWQRRREGEGLDTERPNMVLGADVHTCWEKFARYFEVEARIAPLAEDRYTISAAQVRELIDERTVAVTGVLGTTFTGGLDDLRSLDELLGELEASRGWRIPLHVDAASGGFVIPFSAPELQWDFRLPHVRSINVSNHKFGLVYPGMGTLIFRERADLPEELVFKISYLGGEMDNYSLNFSRPSAQVVLQYYNLLRLGRDGYRQIISTIIENSRALAQRLAGIEPLALVSDGTLLPVVTVKAREECGLDLAAVSARLRERGWIVPAYQLPPHAERIEVLRIVIKESFSAAMGEQLAADLEAAIKAAQGRVGTLPRRRRPHC